MTVGVQVPLGELAFNPFGCGIAGSYGVHAFLKACLIAGWRLMGPPLSLEGNSPRAPTLVRTMIFPGALTERTALPQNGRLVREILKHPDIFEGHSSGSWTCFGAALGWKFPDIWGVW